MKKFIYLFLLFAFSANAQVAVPFWTETFTNGIPNTWTNADASNQNALWTWCSDPASNNGEPGCPAVWNSTTNQQVPFNSTTAETGFVTVDSDEYGNLSTDHISRLTTNGLDCSGKSNVYVKFQAHLGTYTYDADDKALLKVSTDQSNWSTFQIFTGLTTGVRWSDNPEFVIIDISQVAANQGTVYLQWEWTGNYEYMWNLDDIELYSQNPTPRHDLMLSASFYPVSSFATPASELRTDTFGFEGYVSNFGLDPQTNVQLKAWITDANGAVLFADSAKIDVLPVDYRDSLIVLNNRFAPELPEGTYSIHYAVSADSTDLRPSDNGSVNQFIATAGQFAKENAAEQYFRPNGVEDLPSYTICNYYRTSKSSLEQYRALSAEFTHTVEPTEIEITNVVANVYLLRVNDAIDDELSNLDPSTFLASYNWVGIAEYTADATAVDDGSIRTVDLTDFNTGELGVLLEEGARYVLAISYSDDSRFVYHAFNNDNNYYFTSTYIYSDGAYSDFGSDANAVLRLNLGLVTTTDQTPLPDYAMQLFPTPATDRINIAVKLDEAGPLAVTIADLNGKVIIADEYANVQQTQMTYNLPTLPAGVYLARIATENGTLTKRFVVAQQ